jgi:LysM repeat protein
MKKQWQDRKSPPGPPMLGGEASLASSQSLDVDSMHGLRPTSRGFRGLCVSLIAGLALGTLLPSPVWAQTFTTPAIASEVDSWPAATETKSITYTVVLGDTLYGISRRKGLSLTELIALNRDTVSDPDLILIGQILQLGTFEGSVPSDIQKPRPAAPAKKVSRRFRHPRPKQNANKPRAEDRIVSIQPTPNPPKPRPAPTAVQPSKQTKSPSSRSDLSKKTLVDRRPSLLANLPTVKLSGNRLGAAKRGSCAAPGQKLVALLPDTNLGQTVADQPTFFWSMPELKPEWQNRKLHSRFRLTRVDAQDTDIDPPVYETEFDSGPIGIHSLTIPKEIPVGQNLRWTLVVVCDPDDPDGNEYVKGWIRRVEPTPQLAAELEQANLVDYPAIYAKAGLWFDSLRYLSAIRRKVGDESIGDDWAALLQQVNLGDLASKPLNCQQESASSTGCTAVP